MALTNSAFAAQLKIASVKPQDRMLNLNLQKSEKYCSPDKICKWI